jgi:hypothetical protein
MTFVPGGSVINGRSAPKKQTNSFTAICPGEMPDVLSEYYASTELVPQVYFEDKALLAALQKIRDLLGSGRGHDQVYAESLGLPAVIELMRLQKTATKQTSVRRGGLSLRQQAILRDHIEDYLHTEYRCRISPRWPACPGSILPGPLQSRSANRRTGS